MGPAADKEIVPMKRLPQPILALYGDQVVSEIWQSPAGVVVSRRPAADHGYRPSLPLELRSLALAAAARTAVSA